MSTPFSRVTAGTALAVVLSIGSAIPAHADTGDPTLPPTQMQTSATEEMSASSVEEPGTDPGSTPDPDPDPGSNPDPGPGADPGVDPGPEPEMGMDPGAGSEEPKPQPETNTGTSNSEKGVSSSTDRGDRYSAHLAATGADERRTLIGSLIAAFFLTAGAAATFWSRSGVRFGRAARTDTV